jgi:hypothetical protein
LVWWVPEAVWWVPEAVFEKSQMSSFMKIRPVGTEFFFYTDGRTGRHDKTNRRYFQNALSSAVFYQHSVFPFFVPATFALYSINRPFFKPTWSVFTARYEMDHYI